MNYFFFSLASRAGHALIASAIKYFHCRVTISASTDRVNAIGEGRGMAFVATFVGAICFNLRSRRRHVDRPSSLFFSLSLFSFYHFLVSFLSASGQATYNRPLGTLSLESAGWLCFRDSGSLIKFISSL